MTEITVALISTAGIILAAIIPIFVGLRRARKENRDQHADNKDTLLMLAGKVDVVNENVRDMRKDFTRHLENHDRKKK
jgi:hypothetical protein